MAGKIFNNSYAGVLPEFQAAFMPVLRHDVQAYIDSTSYSVEQKTAAMTLIRQEAATDSTGKYKYSINNNLGGIQADVSKWPKKWERHFKGVVHQLDGNKDYRWFIAFDTWQSCVDMMLDRIKTRGVYIGGYAPVYAKTYINNLDSFIRAYHQEWVEGSHILKEPITTSQYKDLASIYNQEYKYFSQSIQKKNVELQERLRAFATNSSYNIRFFLFGK